MGFFFQTPFTAAGSWFALCQSAGVLGMAATTKAAVGAVAGGITYVASYAVPGITYVASYAVSGITYVASLFV